MHTHRIRTTEDKLEATIDEWLGQGETPVEALMPVVMYVGGRDFVVVVRHPEHDEALHDQSGRRGHRPHGEAASPVVVHAYSDDSTAEYAGWIEDENRSWILYLDEEWRPSVLWRHRDATGGVIGAPVQLDGETPSSDDAPPDDAPPEVRRRYIEWLERERGWYYNLAVSGRSALAAAGWAPAASDEPTVPIGVGVDWLKRELDAALERVAKAESAAGAYQDAVMALQEVTSAPLSTTLGHLIRRGYLVVYDPKAETADAETVRTVGVGAAAIIERLLEAIRLTQEYAQLPALPGWSWFDIYRELRPDDAERLHREWERSDGAREAIPDGGLAPAWFRYLWTRLESRQIIDVDVLRELTPPTWVVAWLEQPVVGESIYEIDTRMETLRRIVDITSGGAPDGTSRSDWALESLGEVRGLARSQVLGAD